MMDSKIQQICDLYQDHQNAVAELRDKATLELERRIKLGSLLREKKAELQPHGNFTEWLEKNYHEVHGFPAPRTCQWYMKQYLNYQGVNPQDRADSDIGTGAAEALYNSHDSEGDEQSGDSQLPDLSQAEAARQPEFKTQSEPTAQIRIRCRQSDKEEFQKAVKATNAETPMDAIWEWMRAYQATQTEGVEAEPAE